MRPFGLAILLCLNCGLLQADGPRNLLVPQDKSLHIIAPPGAKIEPLEAGGVRITYSVETRPSQQLWVSVKRTFTPAETASATYIDVPVYEGKVLLNVWSDNNLHGFKALESQMGNVVDLQGLSFKGSGEFSGKIKAIEISMQVDRTPGEHSVEIERFELEQ